MEVGVEVSAGGHETEVDVEVRASPQTSVEVCVHVNFQGGYPSYRTY